MFVDEVIVKVAAGDGGDGCTSFRREKFVPMGGPNGGNGGHGANVIFKTDEGLKTLIDLKMMKHVKGDKGGNGKGQDRHGADANDVVIKIPCGTTITDVETGDEPTTEEEQEEKTEEVEEENPEVKAEELTESNEDEGNF